MFYIYKRIDTLNTTNITFVDKKESEDEAYMLCRNLNKEVDNGHGFAPYFVRYKSI
jgi:hypothetical protein